MSYPLDPDNDLVGTTEWLAEEDKSSRKYVLSAEGPEELPETDPAPRKLDHAAVMVRWCSARDQALDPHRSCYVLSDVCRVSLTT